MGASKMDINLWEVFFNGEGHTTRAGYTIVTVYLIVNDKQRSIGSFPIIFYFILFPFFR